MSQNVIQEKSYSFALRIVRLYKHLCDQRQEFVLSRYRLSAGTIIGARVKAAQEAGSRAGFIHEMSVALQQASETEYWLQLMHGGELLTDQEFASINADCIELEKLLTAIVKSSKQGT